MIFRYEDHNTVWVDLEQPNEEEVHAIAHEFGISEQLEAELLSPTPSPIVTDDGSVSLLVLHFPVHNEKKEARDQEVDFAVGHNFIITVRYEVVVSLHHLRKLLETENLVSGKTFLSTDTLLEILFAHLYTAARDYINHITDHLEHVEHSLFEGNEHRTIRFISSISRDFLHLETSLANQEEPLGRFLKALTRRSYFGPSFEERAARILTERSQIIRLVMTHRADARELRETNSALLEVRQNEIMKTLTVITFIMLPLELVALVFGMHLLGTPLEQNPHAFWLVMTFMIFVVGVLTLIFAKKRWIF